MRWSGPWGIAGRVWPRHEQRGRPLNAIVSRHETIAMAAQKKGLRIRWATLPVSLRAVIAGVLIALVAANVWPALLLSLGVPLASIVEVLFLGVYVWWARGG